MTSFSHPMRGAAQGYVLVVILRVVLILLVLGQVVFLAGRYRARVDLTSDQLYSFTGSTQRVLDGMDDRLLIECYFSPDDKLPSIYRELRQNLRGILDEYVQKGKGKVAVQYFDPQSDALLTEKAERLGLRPTRVSSAGTDALSVQAIWQGVRLRYRDAQRTIPVLPFQQWPFQYEAMFTRLIKELTVKSKPKIGVLAFSTDAGTGGMFMQQRGQPQGFTRFKEMLKGRYDLSDLDLNEGKLVPDDVSTVLLIRPKNLTDRQKYALDQFLMRGGSLVVFADSPEVDLSGQRSFMTRGVLYDAQDAKLKFVDQLAHYGVRVEDKMVLEMVEQLHEPIYLAVPGNLGQQVQALPYYYWFHPIANDWADEQWVMAAAQDGDGKIDSDKANAYRNTFKPGINTSVAFLDAVAKRGRDAGPGFFWPCPVALSEKLPEGVNGEVWFRSSPFAMVEEAQPNLDPFGPDPNPTTKVRNYNRFRSRILGKFNSEPRRQVSLAVALRGTFGSFFTGKEIPPRKPPEPKKEEVKDPLAEPISTSPTTQPDGTESAPATQPDVQGPPQPGQDTKVDDKDKDPAPILQGKPARLIVIGDSDFLRDDLLSNAHAQAGGPIADERGIMFFALLLDDLQEDKDLLELSSKAATERMLNFVESKPGVEEPAEVLAQRENRKAVYLRTANIVVPVVLLVLCGLVVLLGRRAQKRAFLSATNA